MSVGLTEQRNVRQNEVINPDILDRTVSITILEKYKTRGIYMTTRRTEVPDQKAVGASYLTPSSRERYYQSILNISGTY